VIGVGPLSPMIERVHEGTASPVPSAIVNAPVVK
jgi:hypothetical protein